MSGRRGVAGFAVLALSLFVGMMLPLPAYADSQVRIVRLSYAQGAVQVDRADGAGFEPAIMNMPITQGMRLWTQGDSRAEAEFEDGSTIRLGPDTRVYFREMGLRDSGARFTTVDVEDGLTYFNVKHKRSDEFRVAFGGREIELTRTVRFRAEVQRPQVRLAVLKGELDLTGPEGEARAKKNETLTLELNDPGRYELARGVTEISYDSWDAARDKYLDQYASSQRYSNSPYAYGRSDLNYYGSWTYAGSYGYVWRPYGVGYGWDPFYNGAWAWYPGGWTWVSSYPWGWTPYRYGSWVFVSRQGWCWRPGGWNTWTRVPPVYNPPPAYKGPQPPPAYIRGTPSTIIVNSGTPSGRPTWLPRNKLDPDGTWDPQYTPKREGTSPAKGFTAGSTAPAPPPATVSAPPAAAAAPPPARPAPRVKEPPPRKYLDGSEKGRFEAPRADVPARPSHPAAESRRASPPPARTAPSRVSPPPLMSAPAQSPPHRSAPPVRKEIPARKTPGQ
jgi:hypothetical protein